MEGRPRAGGGHVLGGERDRDGLLVCGEMREDREVGGHVEHGRDCTPPCRASTAFKELAPCSSSMRQTPSVSSPGASGAPRKPISGTASARSLRVLDLFLRTSVHASRRSGGCGHRCRQRVESQATPSSRSWAPAIPKWNAWRDGSPEVLRRASLFRAESWPRSSRAMEAGSDRRCRPLALAHPVRGHEAGAEAWSATSAVSLLKRSHDGRPADGGRRSTLYPEAKVSAGSTLAARRRGTRPRSEPASESPPAHLPPATPSAPSSCRDG